MLRLDPARSLLLFVDIQEKLAPAMPPARLTELLRASTILLEAARQVGVRVAATEQYPKGLGPTLGALREKLGGVEPVAKDSFSALGEPAFLRVLNAPPPRQVVLLGMETHICVFQTARDLAALGIEVHVPLDGVASRRDDHRDAGLRLCERAGAFVTTAETVAFDWLGRAGTDAFRAISRAVRLAPESPPCRPHLDLPPHLPPPSTPAPAPGAPLILIVDDEPSNLTSLEKIFQREGLRVLTADGARSAIDLLRRHRVQVVLTDLMMPGTSGLELLRAIKEVSPDTEIVMMTAYATVEVAVQAMREGAYDFIEKPLKRMQVVKSVRKAAERNALLLENRSLKDEIRLLSRREIVGQSPALRRVMATASQAAPSSATVLILGETGTGKELLARTIHERSSRAKGPFVAVNCSALPESILEAELFGHAKGAFTDAKQAREGRFAKAQGGTLFLDEIGEVPPQVQVKLLRVLQEGEFEPLGGDLVRADVRIVAATNRDLRAEIERGRFREDLFYRLNVIALTAPPLRARREDIPLLCDHFLGVYCARNNKPRLRLSPSVLRKLHDYHWPGNVRELENCIERAVVLCSGDAITDDLLPDAIAAADGPAPEALTFPVGTPLEEVELRMIRETLRHTKGDKSLAAQLLGISTRTIYRKLGDNPEDPAPGS